MGGEGKNGTRGTTKMTGLTKVSHRNHLEIQFNERGNAIGANRVQFASYLGMIDYSNYYVYFPISYKLSTYNN